MLLSVVLAFFGPGSGSHYRLPQPVDRPLFNSAANAWVSAIRESPAEQQMLWDAERVLFYAGRITGERMDSIILGGLRFRTGLTMGWHCIEPVHSLPNSDQFRITQTFLGRSDRPTVIVVDRRDYQDRDGFEAVADKVAELKRDGVHHVIVLQRGTENRFFQSAPLVEMMLLYWVGDAELTVLSTYDFGAYPMVDRNVLTLDSRTDTLRG